MMKILQIVLLINSILFTVSSQPRETNQTVPISKTEMTAEQLLGNADYQAISYGGYRQTSRDIQPSIEQLKEDMKILSAMGIRMLRTYNVHFPHASNTLRAISELKEENPDFEMYVMLGAWIDCKHAWTDQPPDHNVESEQNEAEIHCAVELANQYPEIVKIIAVGNEAMVKWATAYYVEPGIILKWVNYLQGLKADGRLHKNLWITSSDNFASWGGGGSEYHVEDLNGLINAVDYVSMHTYPMHDTHYNPVFWGVTANEQNLSDKDKIDKSMDRALDYATQQYERVKSYVNKVAPEKPIHIGETGWASKGNGIYASSGSKAIDEYKAGLYYNKMRKWSNENGLSCFYFQAFDEPWKDAGNPGGSENFFGLFTVEGKAKYAIWPMVDQGLFDGLKRGENPIKKTYQGNELLLLEDVLLPPMRIELVEPDK